MSEKKTRLTAYIAAVYGTEVLEQIKNGTKQVLFNGTVVEYNDKFRDRRVTATTKIQIDDFKGVIPEKKSDELPQGGKLDENCYLNPEPFATQSDISPEEEERLYQAEIAAQRQHENLPTSKVPAEVEVEAYKDAHKKDPVEITMESNNENKANIEISPGTNSETMIPEDEEHFEDRFKDAKLIFEMHESGIETITIASRMRIAETRVSEIIKQGIKETETQLRRWYNVPKGKEKKPEPVKSKLVKNTSKIETKEPEVEEPATQDNTSATPAGGKTRIKGGVKLAEEAIVAMLKEKPMTTKELKAAAVEGVNPSTWVIRISKLKGAGKIALGVDGLYTAV